MIDCPVLLGNTDVLFFLPAHAMLCMRGDSTALFRHTPSQTSTSTTCCTSSRTAFLNWCRTKTTFEPLQSTIRRTKSARSAPRASFAWLLQDSHAPFKVLCCLASSEAARCQWRAVRRGPMRCQRGPDPSRGAPPRLPTGRRAVCVAALRGRSAEWAGELVSVSTGRTGWPN
jgi:hypothetical protein